MIEPGTWSAAMGEAIELAQSPDAPHGENPRVGCVIVDESGSVVGRGYHRGAGTPHAEVMALRDAGEHSRGATAVVTLEPCSHTGRTGPCTEALLAAGVARVVFAQTDPTSQACGGAELLRAAGLDVIGGVRSDDAAMFNTAWTFAVRIGRPMVTWKSAVSLDGRVAGPDGGPTPLTGAAARLQVHQLRADVDAIVVGTGTVLIDDPALTVRIAGHSVSPAPLRVVVGSRPIPADARVLDDSAPTLVIDEPDPAALLGGLYSRGIRHVLLEGGPTLAAAFLSAHVIDRIEWYLAPVLLGSGPVALPGMGSDPQVGVDVIDVSVVGEDVRIVGSVRYEGSEA